MSPPAVVDGSLRTLMVCADDFGLSAGIDRVVLGLAARGRLSAISCLVNFDRWPVASLALRDLPDGVEVGLHLDLTEGRPCSATLAQAWPTLPALPRLILRAHLRRLPLAALRDEIHAQLAAFVAGVGRGPDFIDGHQHVHHLPGIREQVLEAAAAITPRPPLRATGRVRGPGFAVKRMLIEATGGWSLVRAMRSRAWPHNAALLGVYDFAAIDYGALMRRWLASVPPQGALLFCHPGDPADPGDPIAAARRREAAYLGSDMFASDLRAAGVGLGSVWR
ncbi:MAG: ChbG/HpnK family deacetylase [Burkholderiaceae bacterium]